MKFGHAAASCSRPAGDSLGVVARVVDDADAHRRADRLHMRDDAGLFGHHQVVRQHQDTRRSGLLGAPGQVDRHARAIAHAGQHRHIGRAVVDRGADHRVILVIADREELARAARREQPRRPVGRQPLQALGIAGSVELAIDAEIGDRK